MKARGVDDRFESLRVSCRERVLTELRDEVKLPKCKIDAKIISWDETHFTSKHFLYFNIA